jgi:hypothetical protein
MSLRLGAVTTVVISSPDVARELLQKQDAVFANRFVPHADSATTRQQLRALVARTPRTLARPQKDHGN